MHISLSIVAHAELAGPLFDDDKKRRPTLYNVALLLYWMEGRGAGRAKYGGRVICITASAT